MTVEPQAEKSKKKKKDDTPGPGPTPPPTWDKATIDRMKENIPTALETIFDLPEGEGKNIYDLFTIVLGAQNKDIYSVLERTDLTEEEIPIFCDLIQQAEHGIGMDGLDFPIPLVGERVVRELRARRSKNRESSHEFERITSGWLAALRAKEAAAEKKDQQANKFVGN